MFIDAAVGDVKFPLARQGGHSRALGELTTTLEFMNAAEQQLLSRMTWSPLLLRKH